jgi:predicted Rossmann-fold nucleotide-binding protein
MADRLVIVGAVGGDRQGRHAHAFGKAVAKSNCILLTGGGDHRGDEVKNAAVRGCLAARCDGAVGRAIGILPSDQVRWESADAWHLLLHTGLKHYLRNLLNGVTPDIVVVFAGGRGTLAEAAFAMAAGRPILFFGGEAEEPAVVRLRRNFERYFSRGDSADVEMYLNQPLQHWRDLYRSRLTTCQLRELLCERLRTAADWPDSAEALAQHCVEQFASLESRPPMGFPGLPGEPDSRLRFQQEIARMSEACTETAQ